MGIGAVLVDRARKVSRAPTSSQVDGATVYAWVRGPWFPVRLSDEPKPEADTGQGGPKRTQPSPTLMYRPKAPDGSPIVLQADDRVEVVSKDLGVASEWMVTGDQQAMRKKRTVIGYTVGIQRVEEHQTPRGAPSRRIVRGGGAGAGPGAG